MAEPSQETVGQRIRRLRLERGLSQRDLSAPGITYAYVSRIETGGRKPSLKAMRHLARRLGVDLEYLETGDPIPALARIELQLSDAELAVVPEDVGSSGSPWRLRAAKPLSPREDPDEASR
jgi:transcriptional regulator with XRE-family HTH domain